MKNRLNFTIRALNKLECPPDKLHCYFYDLKRSGLCVLVTRAGHKSFFLYRKVEGRPERIRLGTYPAMTIDQARDAADRIQGKIAEGDNPAEEKRTAKGEATLAVVFTRYIDEYAKIHKRTWEDDRKQFDRYADSIRGRRLSEIDRHTIQRLHSRIGTEHGPYSANRLLALLSKVFSFARDLGFEAPNPAAGVKRFREHSRERFIQPDEMPKFLAALDDHPDPAIADFFRVLLFTGARRANVQAMAWGDVNFSRRTWTVAAEEAKGGSALTIYLSDPAMAVLQRLWNDRTQDAAFVFPGHGATGHIMEPKMAWKAILKRAGITGVRIHDLRRTYGSWLAAGGASLPMISKALGHKSQQATQIYARLNIDPIKSSIDAAAAAMTAATRPATVSNVKATA